MRIEMRFVIDCEANAAWDALHDPQVVSALYEPVLQVASDETLPARWNGGGKTSVEVRLLLFGRVPVGRQVIDVNDETQGEGVSLVRTMHDRGRATGGPLMLLSGWHHRMSVWSLAGDPARTVWLDRVSFRGPFAIAAWPVMRVIWGLRARRIRTLARSWRAAPNSDAVGALPES